MNKKQADNAIGHNISGTESKNPEKGWREELHFSVMEDYIVTAELGHLAKDEAKHKEEMRYHYEKLKTFIQSKIDQAHKEGYKQALIDIS